MSKNKRGWADNAATRYFFSCLIISAFIFIFLVVSYGKEKFVYDAAGRRNPFIPLVTTDGRLIKLDTKVFKQPLNVQGVIYDNTGMSYALVNNTVVRVGDIVDGNQVLKIEENKVSFVKDGQILELEIKNGGENEK